MKKIVLGIGFVALVFLVFPAVAARPPQGGSAPSAADQAFLASLAAPAPGMAAKRPATGVEGKALCTASANCGSGGTISCSGNSTCSNVDQNCSVGQRGSVTCDSVTTQCPNACPCDLNCSADRQDCISDCDPCPAIFSCNMSTCTESCRCKFSGCPVR